MRWQSIASLALVILAVAAAPATAQDIPYHNYLVGDRALGLGGAFVGLADDASASFHNPAGLALLPEASISASFWVVALHRRDVESGWLTLEGTSDLSDQDLNAPPLVVTAVAKLGPREAGKHKRHAVGAAVLKPLRETYRYSAAAFDTTTSSLSSLDVIHSDQARWYGGSYAYDTQRGLAFGASLFMALRSMHHEEIEVHGDNGPTDPSPPGFAITRHSVFDATLRDAVLRLGMMWYPQNNLRFGLMVQLPTWGLTGEAHNRELTVDIIDAGAMGNSSLVQNIEHDSLHTSRPIPWEARLGGAWYAGSQTLLTIDLTIHGPAGRRSSPVKLISDPAVPLPRFLAMETHLAPSVRAAIGGETFVGQRVPVRGGLLTYRSGLPDVPARSGQYYASDLNTVGASFSIGWIMDDGHEISLGAAGTYSWGEGSALDQTDVTGASYLATPVSETTVLVFMSGGTRAFKRIARRLYQEGGDLIRRGQQWMDR